MPAALSLFFDDLKYAFRVLRRSPRDTFMAAAILGLGIGANTTMFSALSHVLWRPLPFPDEARLIRLREMITDAGGQPHPFNMSSRAILTIASTSGGVFDGLVAMSGQDMTLAGPDGSERVSVVLQTDGADDTLRVAPIEGRGLTPGEAREGIGAGVALVSYAEAQTRFGGPARAIGAHATLDNRPFTIVGVMPPQYTFPYEAQFWVPWALDPADRTRDFAVWARTRPGTTPKLIAETMARAADEIRRETPGTPAGYGIEVRGIRENLLGSQDRPLRALTGIVSLMLLVAAINVATLLLARSVARQREFAVRAALGQSRGRHVSQLLAESLALAAAGAGAGLLLTAWLRPLTATFVPTVLSGQLGLPTPSLDGRVTAFAIAVSIGSAIVAGIVPAFAGGRSTPQLALAGGGRGMTTGRRGRAMFGALIVAETALTLVLLAGAGLVIRNFARLYTQPLGFDARGLLAIELTPSPAAYPDGERKSALLHRILEEVASAPGVARAAATTVNPLGGGTWGASVVSEALAAQAPDAAINVNHRLITPGLFDAMAIPLLRGRSFTSADRAGTQPVAIVSERLASRLWPNQDPIGARLRSTRAGAPWVTVVGVAGNVSDSHDPGVPLETWYLPFDQQADSAAAEHVYLMIRDGGHPLSIVSDVRRAIARVDPTLAPYRPVAMDEYRSESIARERASAAFMSGFGAFGLLLAALGVYGVMAVSVAQRTAEFGIRMALGARAADIVPLALNRSIAMVGIGVAIGAAASVALNRALASLLPEVGRVDFAAVGTAAALIVAAAVAACVVPALGAARLDPVAALKDAERA